MSELKPQPYPSQDSDQDELAKAFRDVLASASGKRVLFWVLEQSAIYQDAYTGDDGATNYTLGRQSIGRRLIDQLDRLDPRTYPRLLLDVADMKAMDAAADAVAASEDDEYEAP